MSLSYSIAPAVDVIQHLQARGFLSAITHGVLVIILVIFLIGLLLGIAVGFFVGRAVGRR